MILCHFEGCSPAFYCQRSKYNKAKLKICSETCTDSFFSSGILLQTTPVLVSSRLRSNITHHTCTRFRFLRVWPSRHTKARLLQLITLQYSVILLCNVALYLLGYLDNFEGFATQMSSSLAACRNRCTEFET